MLLDGTYGRYNTKHLEVLNKLSIETVKANIDLIDQFLILRDKPLHARWQMIGKLGLYRQTWDGNSALYLGAILRKL